MRGYTINFAQRGCASAAREVQRALSHAELLFAREKLGVKEVLRYAIEGETFEYTEMYPKFRHATLEEGNSAAQASLLTQKRKKQ